MSDYEAILRALAADQVGQFNQGPVSQFVNAAATEASGKLGAAGQAIVQALIAPGNALRGEYDQVGIMGDGSVTMADPRMYDDATELSGLVGLGAMPMPRPSNSLGMFGGKMAKTADLDALERAKALDASGAPREGIWNDTGWFKGADGQWRFEIDDSAVPFEPIASDMGNGQTFLHLEADSYGRTIRETAGRILPHDELYGAHPDLAGVEVGHASQPFRGSYDHDLDLIGLRANVESLELGRGTLLHELQHAVQKREGFARGGNPAEFQNSMPDPQAISDARVMESLVRKGTPIEEAPQAFLNMVGRDVAPEARELIRDMDALNAMPSDPMEAYRRLAGEVEARNVQTRMNMTPEQRKAQAPWLTQDVPDNLQIIRMLFGQ